MSIEAYEANLNMRLEELRRGDPAYDAHTQLVLQAIIYASQLHGCDGLPQRVLDGGCGLGFMTKEIAKFYDAIGIDPSEKSIALAKNEHKGVQFYDTSMELFPEEMRKLGIPSFDQVVLNMVLHSVDDESVLRILKGAKECLKPEGTIILVVPTKDWLIQKLIEYAQDQSMERDCEGLAWVGDKLNQTKVDLPIRITNGSYYPTPLTIYNRTTGDYERFLKAAGYGFEWNEYDQRTGKLISSETLTYMDMNDYYISDVLYNRNRVLMMSFSAKSHVG